MCSVPIPTDHIPHSKESPPEKKTQSNNQTIRELSKPFTCVRVNLFKKNLTPFGVVVCRSQIIIGLWSKTLCAAIIDYGKRSIDYSRKIKIHFWNWCAVFSKESWWHFNPLVQPFFDIFRVFLSCAKEIKSLNYFGLLTDEKWMDF